MTQEQGDTNYLELQEAIARSRAELEVPLQLEADIVEQLVPRQEDTLFQQLETAITDHMVSSLNNTSIRLPEESGLEDVRLREAHQEADENGSESRAEVGLVISALVHQLVAEGYGEQEGMPAEQAVSVALKTLGVTQSGDIEFVQAELMRCLESWSGMSAA